MPNKQPEPFSSALARELSHVPAPIRRRFGIPDTAIVVLDMVIEAIRTILETTDPALLEPKLLFLAERFESVVPDFPSESKMRGWARWASINAPGYVERNIKLVKGGRQFWRRLLGAAHYDRLTAALAEDGGLLLLAGRRFARYVLPMAVALDDLASVLPESKRADFQSFSGDAQTYLGLIYKLDGMIDSFVEKRRIPFEHLPFRENEDHTFDVNMDTLLSTLRASLESETMERTVALSDVLSRKLQGFSDALDGSADGVSQAANSLTEFIDRLLRGSFSDGEVMNWIEAHYPESKSMTFTKDGKTKPTKYAQALCFVMAGGSPVEGNTHDWNRMAALALVEVRDRAEKIKHSDRATPEEAELLRKLMGAARGYFVFSIRVSWALIDKSQFDDLQARFNRVAA